MQHFATITIGVGLLATSACASAAGQLAPVTVHRDIVSAAGCQPPSYARDCAAFHAALRRNFSTREIGMLFGAATAYLEYPTAYERVRTRYAAFVSNAGSSGLDAAVVSR